MSDEHLLEFWRMMLEVAKSLGTYTCIQRAAKEYNYYYLLTTTTKELNMPIKINSLWFIGANCESNDCLVWAITEEEAREFYWDEHPGAQAIDHIDYQITCVRKATEADQDPTTHHYLCEVINPDCAPTKEEALTHTRIW